MSRTALVSPSLVLGGIVTSDCGSCHMHDPPRTPKSVKLPLLQADQKLCTQRLQRRRAVWLQNFACGTPPGKLRVAQIKLG